MFLGQKDRHDNYPILQVGHRVSYCLVVSTCLCTHVVSQPTRTQVWHNQRITFSRSCPAPGFLHFQPHLHFSSLTCSPLKQILLRQAHSYIIKRIFEGYRPHHIQNWLCTLSFLIFPSHSSKQLLCIQCSRSAIFHRSPALNDIVCYQQFSEYKFRFLNTQIGGHLWRSLV